MNDFFLYFRNGNHKRYDGSNRKPYNNYSNKGNDRPKGNGPLHRVINKEYWPVIKQVLEDVAVQQKRRADAEERKADALEAIAKYVMHLTGSDTQSSVETDPDLPVQAPETAATAEDSPEAPSSEVSADTDQERTLGAGSSVADRINGIKLGCLPGRIECR